MYKFVFGLEKELDKFGVEMGEENRKMRFLVFGLLQLALQR